MIVRGARRQPSNSCGDDSTGERTLIDSDALRASGYLLPHEFVHFWNGKYRRPSGLISGGRDGGYDTPMKGDPAFDGMELQVADFRYNTQAKDSELTGGIYRAIAPSKQVYKPTEWNKFRVELKGIHLKVTLNGEVIQDVDLDKYDQPVKRHDGSNAPPVKDRPKRGHIGFQHLSRNNEPVMIRSARIRVLE